MVLALSPATGSYALSDIDYQELMELPQFRAADHDLTKYWKTIYKNLPYTANNSFWYLRGSGFRIRGMLKLKNCSLWE